MKIEEPNDSPILLMFGQLIFLTTKPAERLGFEPRVPVRVRRISSAVHSTTLASLLSFRLQRYKKKKN